MGRLALTEARDALLVEHAARERQRLRNQADVIVQRALDAVLTAHGVQVPPGTVIGVEPGDQGQPAALTWNDAPAKTAAAAAVPA